ncbi:HlyC/CorC family transporter [Anaeromicropila herbilytica]|uniref:Membrane protein n=1 Tax=Anaeromicropila herbilytica TaxID=2785025 RepID=A0A7R7EK56_9FIRM|nr:hemolysin family protein [Anaeromicropila herbilytica]BCN30253.1 membrane protein [Anaeromicropila herbilytica]
MDPSEVTQLFILFILILLSAFFSSAETAFKVVNKLRIRTLADEDIKGSHKVIKLIEEPEKMLSAILIGKNIVILTAATITTRLTLNHFHSIGVGIATGILTIVLLIFGETIPKTITNIYAEKLALTYGGFIALITLILTPIIFIVDKISNGILKIFGINAKSKLNSITESELRTIVEFSHEEGVIESEERKMITNVVDFGDSLAKDLMVPRINMEFANIDFTYDELVAAFEIEKYSRLPVYKETKDNIVGIINLKDIFFYHNKKEDFHIESIMRKPYFTYEFKKTSELLVEMRRGSMAMAIVLDEYGATAGLITLEDLLEEIVGDIKDEYDEDEEESIQCISENEYIAEGNTRLYEINEVIGLNLESDEYDSIAGHIITLLEHLPVEGESVTDKNITYTVDSLEKNRIEKVHIVLHDSVEVINEEDD